MKRGLNVNLIKSVSFPGKTQTLFITQIKEKVTSQEDNYKALRRRSLKCLVGLVCLGKLP